MMTKEQVHDIVNDIRIHSDYPWKHNLYYLKAHDAEQRRLIEELEQQNAALRETLESIVKIRFLLGNDPKLNPAYEMGEIAQQALKGHP